MDKFNIYIKGRGSESGLPEGGNIDGGRNFNLYNFPNNIQQNQNQGEFNSNTNQDSNNNNNLEEKTTINLTGGKDDILNHLIHKVNYLDYQMNGLVNLGVDVTELKHKVKDHDEIIKDNRQNIDESKW